LLVSIASALSTALPVSGFYPLQTPNSPLSKEGTSTFPSVVFNAPVFSKRCGTWQAGTGEEYAFRVIRAIRGCLFIISKAEFPLTAAARDADTFVGFHQNI